jgi:Carboxypeptidase regulatory-like domain
MNRRTWLSGVVAVLMVLGSAIAASAQGVGAIGGTVMDSTGAVLPGATVSLSSAEGGTVGGSQEAVSDTRGAYQFLRLVPGTYTVKATMQGFRSVEQRNIVVNADATARADLQLPIGQLEEGVVVSGEAPLLDTTSALKQTVLSQETLQALPNRIDVWSITRVIPSVVANKVDVGGSESFQQSGITVHGTNNENGYYIDGMNVSSTQSSGSIATFYLDPYAFEEANFRSGNGPAEATTGGLVFNMISRTGTNRFHGGTMVNGTNHNLGSDNVNSTLAAQILRNVPASVKAVRPDLKPTADIRYLFDYGGWASGPVSEDKLWYSLSFHHQQILQYLVGSYNPDGTSVPDDNMLWNFSGKMAWQMSQKSQLSWFYILQYKKNGHRGSTSNFLETGATTANTKYPQLHQVKWTSSRSSKMVLDVSGSLNRVDDYQPWPKEGDSANCKSSVNKSGCFDGLIAGFDQVTNTDLRILPTYRDLPNTRVFLQGSVNYFTQAHDVKAGWQFDYAWNEVLYFSSSGMRANYRAGVPDSVFTYNTPARAIPENIQQGYYVQDKWRPGRKVTINAGVRLDSDYGWQRALCQEKTPFVDGRCYDKMKGIPDWKSANPRFSAVYDLAGDGRTALKFSANRYIVPVGSAVLDRVNPIFLSSDTRPWTACAAGQTSGCDLNGDRLPQLNELGPSSGFNFGNLNRYASGYKWPWAKEYTAEIQRQLPGNLVATIGYTRREKRGTLGVRNVLVPPSAYTPVTVTEVNSGRTVTVYNKAAALRTAIDNVWNNDSTLDSNYNGTDISLDKRMSRGWMMTGGVSFGKTTGYNGLGGTCATSNGCSSDLNNPNANEFTRGIYGNDVPFSLRLSGIYDLPYGIAMSGTFQHQRGFPEATLVSVGNNTIALTQGTTTLMIEPRGTTRLPDLNQLDMSFRKVFRVGPKTYAPRVDIYNLANSATVISRVTTLGSSYFAINGVQRGRLVKIGMNVDF